MRHVYGHDATLETHCLYETSEKGVATSCTIVAEPGRVERHSQIVARCYYRAEIPEAVRAMGCNRTNVRPAVTVNPQVIEINGRPEWTRTIDLLRVREAL